MTISPLICRALMLINSRAYRGQSTGHDISRSPVFLGGASYHLKKIKPLSEAQKEAVCIVNMVRGTEIFSLGSEPTKIVVT